MTKEYIKLQNSHVTQQTNGHIKSEWTVKENITGDSLQVFPNTIDENTMFSIMDFAKKYELVAFNEGIKFGKNKVLEVYLPKIKQMEERIESMKAENERLSSVLEQEMLGGAEND
jgi:hypothetical protein